MELSPSAIAAVAGAAGGEAKRARKRSKYLSPPYTDTEVKVRDDGKEEEPPPDVCAADVLSALRAAALLSLDAHAAQALLHFLTLHRTRTRKTPPNPMLHAPAADVGHKALLNLPTDPAPPMPAPAPGSKKKRKKMLNTQQPAPAVTKEEPPKRRRKKRKMGEHFGNPVALVLDFAQGTPLPSRDHLLSTFCQFGSVIHSETALVRDQRSARVVFATRAEAEAAYSCAETLGAFGPPFAAPRLQDHPPITLDVSPPAPKLPLEDIRKNLEKMILSLTHRSSSIKAALPEEAKPAMGNLVQEMQGLLAKVDNMLLGAPAAVDQH